MSSKSHGQNDSHTPRTKPIVCDQCGKSTLLPFDGVFEHIEHEADKAGFVIEQDPFDDAWCTTCKECRFWEPGKGPSPFAKMFD